MLTQIEKKVETLISKLYLQLPPRAKKLWTKTEKIVDKWSRRKKVVMAINVVCLIFFLSIMGSLFIPLPKIKNFGSRNLPQSTKIYDRTGKVMLYDFHGSVRRTAVNLDEISDYMKKATIETEDKDFYSHKGFSVSSILRALKSDLLSLKMNEGGSTITQQLVKNSLLTNKKTISRKLKEIILAMRLEKKYTKNEILEAYLNEIPYGGVIYGVEEASQYFFGVHASELTLAQSAYLATLPKRPTFYSPYGENRPLLDKRKDMLLKEMLNDKVIAKKEYDEASHEQVAFMDEKNLGIKAPHFVFYVKNQLVQKYGEEMLEKGGLKVITTLDWDLEKNAEEILTKKALENEKKLNASNAGLVAIDPKTGQILAMVGSRGYFDESIDGKVNITLAKRQPGSTFKPFAYATAFEKGYTPETVVFDLKTQFSTRCAPNDFVTNKICYSPSNFNNKIHGPISMRDALAQSVNIASVKVLYLAGLDDSIKTAESMGVTTLSDRSRFGLSLVLGGGEVTLLDMTSAYGVFANDGVKNPPVGILSVENAKGEVVDEYVPKAERVLDPEIARTISDILSDNAARAPEFGWNSPLYFANAQVASKTGTTNDFRDAWIIGYNSSIVIGVWAGNNDNKPMIRKIAEFSAAPLWHETMAYAMNNKYPAGSFIPPQPKENLAVLPPVLRGDWNPDPNLGIHDILYWVNKDNPISGAPNSENDPQLSLWEYPVQQWAYAHVYAPVEASPIMEASTTVPTGTTTAPMQSTGIVTTGQ